MGRAGDESHTPAYGIDQMAVGLACAPAGGDPFATVSLGVFRPADYYKDGGLRD